MCDISEYNEEEHYRNFAIWAAARAASRGHAGLTVDVWSAALKNLNYKMDEGLNCKEFDENYCDFIEELLVKVNSSLDRNNQINFGRAAKFLAIYFKVMFRHTTSGSSPYGDYCRFAHLPIDRILLKNIAKSCKKLISWNQSNDLPCWTKFERKNYMGIIHELRGLLPIDQPLWKIEQFWML